MQALCTRPPHKLDALAWARPLGGELPVAPRVWTTGREDWTNGPATWTRLQLSTDAPSGPPDATFVFAGRFGIQVLDLIAFSGRQILKFFKGLKIDVGS